MVPDIPLIPLPDRWPTPVVATLAMVALAALDLGGALLAKSWLEHRTPALFAAGVAVFGLLFWVYGSSLRYAELATVTFGWIVLLQVALLLIDRFVHGVDIGPAKWAAAVGIMALQGFLVLGPSQPGETTASQAMVSCSTTMPTDS